MTRRLVPAVGLVALLAIPASASASTKSKSATLTTQSQSVTVKAKCAHGDNATGGGFRTSTPNLTLGGSIAVALASRKAGQHAWSATFEEIAGSVPTKVTTFVYCSSDAPKTKTVSKTVVSPPGTSNFGQLFTVDAKCPGGGKAQAGGFFSPPLNLGSGPAALVSDNFRSGSKTWRTQSVMGNPGAVTTGYVYCAKGSVPTARSKGTAHTQITPPTLGLATAFSKRCKGGTGVVAGGFSQPGKLVTNSPNSANIFILPWASLRSGKKWSVSMAHDVSGPASTPDTLTLNSIAYCA
jgi:hypothetical protein